MKQLLIFSLLFLTVEVSGQSVSTNPDLTVLEAKWNSTSAPSTTIMSDTDPFRANVDARRLNRARSETDRENNLRAKQGLPPVPQPMIISSDSEKSFRYSLYNPKWYKYEAKVTNTGLREVKFIEWDYVFTDVVTQQEVGRIGLASQASIKPQGQKRLSGKSIFPPARTVNVNALGKRESNLYRETVEIKRLFYSDGSVWTASAK